MYNPNLDISQIPNDSHLHSNGICSAQVIFLWQGKPPFSSSLHDVFTGPLEKSDMVETLKAKMRGITKKYPGDMCGVGSEPVFAQGFYSSLAGFVLRTPAESYTHVRPHIEAEMVQSQCKPGKRVSE